MHGQTLRGLFQKVGEFFLLFFFEKGIETTTSDCLGFAWFEDLILSILLY